ncbi:hypothetical protein V8B97DRAFT_456197 [Scleroderma yunnanense]
MRLVTSFVFGAVLATSILFGSQRILDNLYIPGNAPRVTPKAFPEDIGRRLLNHATTEARGRLARTPAPYKLIQPIHSHLLFYRCAYHASSLGKMSSFECTMAGGDAYFCVFEGLGFCVKPKGNVVTANMQNGECLRLGGRRQ